jgi:asparagine synthase (glutamine-hydrolysing)
VHFFLRWRLVPAYLLGIAPKPKDISCAALPASFHVRSIPTDPAHIHAMAATQAHRGPDHEGFYQGSQCALASRRLAIIDVAGGNQPIEDSSRGLVLVFNGEIYNYRELRSELIQPRTHIPHGLGLRSAACGPRPMGTDALSRLNGMFAVAI